MAETTQYVTVTIPANHPCERAKDHAPMRWPVPLTVRARRPVSTNKSRGSFRANSDRWFFGWGAYDYSFLPWEGFTPQNERFGARDFTRKETP